jgi:hypothetical protein
MSTQPALSSPVSPALSPAHPVRAEYLDFQDVEGHREYRFRVYGPDGSGEFRMRIARAAFDARRVRIQDGPDLCYQKLLRALAAGQTVPADVSTIDDGEFARYLEDHTQVTKRRSPPASTSRPPDGPVRPQHRPSAPRPAPKAIPAAPSAATEISPALEEGQRVRHAAFGLGVTTATSSARTVVSFDEGGPRSFVTSMLVVEVLSAPHTWNASPRGGNRACAPVG